jgi:starch synthase
MSKFAPLVTRTPSVDGVRVKGYPFGKGSFAHVDKKLSGALDTFEANLETLSEQVDADLVHVHTWYAHLGGILAKTLYGIPVGAYGAFA